LRRLVSEIIADFLSPEKNPAAKAGSVQVVGFDQGDSCRVVLTSHDGGVGAGSKRFYDSRFAVIRRDRLAQRAGAGIVGVSDGESACQDWRSENGQDRENAPSPS